MNLEFRPETLIAYPRWLRTWSALTVIATIGLIAVGTLVTTFRVGMADPIWPTAPWHLLLVKYAEPSAGYFIEHAHRIAGYLGGTFILVQTVALWWYSASTLRRIGSWLLLVGVGAGTAVGMRMVKTADVRSVQALINPGFGLAMVSALAFLALAWTEVSSRSAGGKLRAMATLAFIGVVAQGMFGGLRVYLNELRGKEFEVIHGVFAQLVLAAVCLVGLMSSARWNSLTDFVVDRSLRWLAAATAALALVQIFFGGLLRHLYQPMAVRLHPLLAFGVLALTAWTAAWSFRDIEGAVLVRRKAIALLGLILIQAALGVEAWLRLAEPANRYGATGIGDAALRSAHVLVGFGIFSSAVLLAARAWKGKLI
jgi:heme a synthase